MNSPVDPYLLHHYFERTAARLPHKAALQTGEQVHTYADLERATAAVASFLVANGLRRGGRVAIFADNGFELVVSIFATLRAGGVFMPVNSSTKADKLAYLLGNSEADFLITQDSLRQIAQTARERASGTRAMLVVAGMAETDSSGAVGFSVALAHTRVAFPTDVIDQDLAALIYTSGSTGDPKGVMLTHLNMVSAARSVSTYLGLCEDDRILCGLPLAFDYGLYQILMAFKLGATVVLERSLAFPAKVLELLQRERITVLPGVPTLFSMLVNFSGIGSADASSLRLFTNTAAALPVEHIHQLRKLFPHATLFSMYGLTECKRVTFLPPDQLDIRPQSVGRGMPNEEVWLVDEHGQRLPNGSIGELVIRGSNVMRGYWRKPKETAEKLKPGPNPGEWLLYSGDTFRTDEEGYLYFVARKDDIIKSRGEKVSPREVEDTLYALEGVVEAAVIGVPDQLLGSAIKAFVVLKEGYKYSERDLIKHCLARLESFMVPKYVEFVAALPKTDTGKIRKVGLS